MKGSKMNLAFGLETIYEDAEFLLGDRDKVGIVGVNGAGKTTLFRILLHELELDSGTITVGNARIGYLPQEIVIEDEKQTVWEYLQDGRPIRKINSELELIYAKLETSDSSEQGTLLERMGKLQDRLEYFDCYEAEEILLDLVDSMQIDLELLERPI